MRPASFFTYTGAGRVSIARFPPRDTPKGFRVYKALAPGPWFNSVDKPEYERRYAEQLAQLDPAQVRADLEGLAGEHEPVLLCWEKPPFSEKNWCHRRLVARWLLDTSGLQVPELVARPQLEALVWKHTHKDFRGKSDDGTKCVLHLNTDKGGTESWPLSKFSDGQLIDKLPKAVLATLDVR
jgi:hypothetical protein